MAATADYEPVPDPNEGTTGARGQEDRYHSIVGNAVSTSLRGGRARATALAMKSMFTLRVPPPTGRA
jgi:hypothetical protein